MSVLGGVQLRTDLFEKWLGVEAIFLRSVVQRYPDIPWEDFFLNPRRLRGSDFLMRWSQGVWSEQRIIEALERTQFYFALPYGPSGTAPDRSDPRAFELYFERLERAGLGRLKRPDILVFRSTDRKRVEEIVSAIGGISELPFTPEEAGSDLESLLKLAILAVECENSLWKAKSMPHYGSQLRPMKRLRGKLGLPKSAIVPTIIVKDEDLQPLLDWQRNSGIDIHIWHVFFDLAYGIALDRVEELIGDGSIEPKIQIYQAPGGAITRKKTYNAYYHYGYLLAEAQKEPILIADYIVDENGHILPYVKFAGGRLSLSQEALSILHKLSQATRGRN
jgi:hypothetical protein